jgi:Zn-dependent M28 family amino/carboxypeptidase
MAAEYIYTALADYGLDVWYEDFVTDDGLLALNVVGELPGRDPSAVYLVLAHFDSLNPADLASSPGADDNATGVAAMLEIARLLAGHELAHPVRFFATNVEEVGLQGVKAFAARAAEEGTPIAGAFNLDAVGSAAHGSQIVFNTDEGGVWLEDLMVRVNDQYGLGQAIVARVSPNIVADDNFLRDYGYPTVLVARELFGWSTIHHTIDDTVETIDLYNVRMAAALVLGAVANLVVT